MLKKRILVAPLNWGLGHASRCIPIINELLLNNFEVIIASDGAALELLKLEFPKLECYDLPSYNIRYSAKRSFFTPYLLLQTPKILAVIAKEKKATEKLVSTLNLSGIISDNRWGVRSKNIPSVIITHQLKVLSRQTTFISSKIQQYLISKFTECWVPDNEEEPKLSGVMGHIEHAPFPIKYIGALSRFSKELKTHKYKYGIVLSGPEPQRSILEKKLLQEFQNIEFPVVFIKGIIEAEITHSRTGNLTIYNYLFGQELQSTLNQCEYIICRSGYSSIMDIATLEKKAFLLPTPGQPEQEYLASYLLERGMILSAAQENFNLELLEDLGKTKGLQTDLSTNRLSAVFALF